MPLCLCCYLQEASPYGFQKLVDVLRLRKIYGMDHKIKVPVRREEEASFKYVPEEEGWGSMGVEVSMLLDRSRNPFVTPQASGLVLLPAGR